MGEVIFITGPRELRMDERLELAGKLLEFRARQQAKGAAQPIEQLVVRFAKRRFWSGISLGIPAGLVIGALLAWVLR